MRILFFLLFLNLSHTAFGNTVTTVYLFPGQGSDERLFSKIKLDSDFRLVNIVYPVPEKGATMTEFAHVISKQIDTSGAYIFIGVSLGGMLCTEMADFMNPEKIIIISSAECYKELPFRYRFQKTIPLNKIIPKRLMKWGAQILQPIVEPDREKEKTIFKSMLESKSPLYYKRTVNMIINWDRKKGNSNIIHIHGTNDHTIPIRNVKADYTIENGSHMMTLTRGDEINKLIESILIPQNCKD
ncbi:MAG TPA: alpha/beta hydrolase [Bacteroidia bacterium]|nr:alpha/beta hydrolase [Bacteroidia bacterium]